MARYALVTGAAGDIGRATCGAMAADGWGLFITDHPAQPCHGTPTALVVNAGIQGDLAPVHEYKPGVGLDVAGGVL